MARLITILCLTGLLIGCSDKKEEDVLPKDKFLDVLTDVYLVDAYVSYNISKDTEFLEDSYGYYKSVFEEHDITREEFEKAYEHYSKNVAEFQKMISKTLNNINKMNTSPANSD